MGSIASGYRLHHAEWISELKGWVLIAGDQGQTASCPGRVGLGGKGIPREPAGCRRLPDPLGPTASRQAWHCLLRRSWISGDGVVPQPSASIEQKPVAPGSPISFRQQTGISRLQVERVAPAAFDPKSPPERHGRVRRRQPWAKTMVRRQHPLQSLSPKEGRTTASPRYSPLRPIAL